MRLRRYMILCVALLSLFFSPPAASSDDFDIAAYAAKYREADQALNGGLGYAASRNSSTLAWGESYILNDYYMLYRVTKDKFWLDKMVQHIDMMIFTMSKGVEQAEARSYTEDEIEKLVGEAVEKAQKVDMAARDPFGYPTWLTQYPGWCTPYYSSAMVTIKETKSKVAKLVPAPAVITDLQKAKQVTGHEYKIYFGDEFHYSLGDLTSWVMLEKWAEFKYGEPLTTIPGVSLKVEWQPVKGDTFIIKTIEQKPLHFVAHDGMALYPIARFIEEINSDKTLDYAYGRKAQAYKKAIAEIFLKKWERYWVAYPNGGGTYKSTESPAEPHPGWLLPLNQNNALGRAFLVFQSARCGDNTFALERARMIACYFRNYLKPVDRAWYWSYWELSLIHI